MEDREDEEVAVEKPRKKAAPSVLSVVRRILEDEGPGKLAQVGETVYKDTNTEQGFVDCTNDIERKAGYLLGRCARRSGGMSLLSSFINVPQATAYKCTPYSYWRELDEAEFDENTRFINNHWEPIAIPSTAVVFSDGVFDFETSVFKTWAELQYKMYGPRIMTPFAEAKNAKPTAKFEEFKQTLALVMPDKEARDYFQKIMGRLLQPHVNIKKAVFIQGPSGSRKTTIATAIMCAMAGVGGFAIEPIDDLAENRFSQANLIGRFANLSDDPDGKADKWVGWFKRYTGSSIMRGEFKKVQAKNYPITAKLVVCCNRMPRMGDASDAVWSRLCVFNFERTGELQSAFETESSDNDKLHAEYWSDPDTRAAILGWLMDGLSKAISGGMAPPESVRTWNRQAAGDADVYRKLLEETYDKGEAEDFIPTSELRAALEQVGPPPSDTTIALYMKTLFASAPDRKSVKTDGGSEQVRGYPGVKRKCQ